MLAKLPAEITQPVVSKLESEQLPEMDSLFSNAEHGYTLHFANEVLTFPLVSHHDQQYAPYTFNWATCCDLPAAHTDDINYGGHYVDLDYKVEVRGSGNTLIALHENYLHGTTLARNGLQRAGVFKKAFRNSEDTDIVKELDDMVI
ncbi:hypothetical protein QCA50_020006 [Cerrena zonata]|uniref:Uncharacterized protein n=1 Tax=Cerrena zonata TaxID=2478898 RepID=A0AAW0FI70_9APHY